MSIRGTSFTGAFSGGAHIDFGVGTGSLANLYTGAFTVAVLMKTTSPNFGLLGGYTDNTAATATGQFFFSNNSGGRLFGFNDFSNGFPSSGADADGINDDVWRWVVISKAAGPAHYEFSYADLATLTWVDGESVGSGDHNNSIASAFFSTWAIYSNGNNSGDIAAIACWNSQLSTTNIHKSCTFQASDLHSHVAPIAGWLFPQATSGSTINDFTGNGANEVSRPNITTSADPAGFRWDLNRHVLWPDTVTPTAAHTDGGAAGITTATGVLFAAGGGVEGVRFYVPNGTTSGEQFIVGLWQYTATNLSTGTLLASKDGGTGWDVHADTWQTINFDNVVSVDHAHAYAAGVWNGHNQGRYVATPSYFSSSKGDLAGVYAWGQNEDISSVAAGYTSVPNGTFRDNAAFGVPSFSAGSGISYLVSPVWLDTIVPQIALTNTAFAITAKALTPVPQPVHVSLGPAPFTIAPKALTPHPGVVHVGLTPAYIFSHSSLVGDIQVTTAVQILWNVEIPVQTSVDLRWGVRAKVTKSVSLLYNTRMNMVPSKVLSILYGVRKQVTKSVNIEYGVRVPVGSPKTVDIRYGVRSKVSQNVDIRYDTQIQGTGKVTKSVEILWQTMVTPTVNEVINDPFYPDPVPPQIITTTSF